GGGPGARSRAGVHQAVRPRRHPGVPLTGPVMRGYLELCTLGDLLVRGSEHHPERDALVLPGVRRSYRELADRATEVARSLTAMGVTRGDRVGLFMPNGAEFIEVLFGILFTGAVA